MRFSPTLFTARITYGNYLNNEPVDPVGDLDKAIHQISHYRITLRSKHDGFCAAISQQAG